MIPIRIEPKDTIYIFGLSDDSVELLFKLRKDGYKVKLVCQPFELNWNTRKKIGDELYIEAFRGFEYFIKHNQMGNVVFALSEDEWRNGEVLKTAFEAGVPYRVSAKPCAYANSILPKQVTIEPFNFDLLNASANAFLNERMTQDLNKAIEAIDFKKYGDLVSIVDRAQRNPTKYKEEADFLSSIENMSEEELWDEVTRISKNVTKNIVIGFEDTAIMRERANEAKEVLERENPDSEIELRGFNFSKSKKPPSSIKNIVYNAGTAYRSLSQMLCKDEISFALIDPSFLYWDSKTSVKQDDLENRFDMVENILPRKHSKDYVVSAKPDSVDWSENKVHTVHVKDFSRTNEMRSYYDYNRFHFTESHTEDFLRGKYKLSEDEYVIVSDAGLESLGLTLDDLKKNGLYYSALDFPYPIGYGVVNGLYKKDDLTVGEAVKRVKSLSSTKEETKLRDFCYRTEKQLGEFCKAGFAYGMHCYCYVTVEPSKDEGFFKVSYLIVTENRIVKKSMEHVELDSNVEEYSFMELQTLFLI